MLGLSVVFNIYSGAGSTASTSQNPPALSSPNNRFLISTADTAQSFPAALNHLRMMGPMQAPGPSLGLLGLPHLAQGMHSVLGNQNDPQLAPFLGSPLMNMLESGMPPGDPASASEHGEGSWYCMQPDGRWQAYDPAISAAIDAAFRSSESINVEIEGRRFAGTAQLLRQYSDASAEDRSMPLPVRRFNQDEAYRRAAAVFFGHAPMGQVGQGWPGIVQGQPPRKHIDPLVCAGGQNTLPKTGEEWRAAVDRIAARVTTRPFSSRCRICLKLKLL